MKLKNSTSGIYRETGPISVQRDYGVRPNKADVVQTRCRWIIGDVTEVLDRNTWKLGKIAKIVENNYFIIRLADCIQLKEFHISSLRVPVQQDPPTTTVHCKQFPATDKVNHNQFLPEHVNGDFHLSSQMDHSTIASYRHSKFHSFIFLHDCL